MKMDKTVKWILIAVAIVVVLAIIILAIKYFTERPPVGDTVPGPSPGTPPGTSSTIIDALAGLFSGDFLQNLFGGKKCDPDTPGFQKNGVYNPDKCGRAPGLECDPDRPGWNLGGLPDPTC